MDCSRVQDLLPDFSVGAVGSRSRHEVEAHLTACADCRRELRLLESVVALVEEHGARQPPAGLFHAVRNRIEAGQVPRERVPWWAFLFTMPARATAMGLAMAAVALGLFFPVAPATTALPGPDLPTIGASPSLNTEMGSSEVGSSVRQHAMTAAEGPLSDRVAWEAMAQLASQDSTGQSGQTDPTDDGGSDNGNAPGGAGL